LRLFFRRHYLYSNGIFYISKLINIYKFLVFPQFYIFLKKIETEKSDMVES
jgi:hypothetical protein